MSAANVLRLTVIAVIAGLLGLAGGWLVRAKLFASDRPPTELYLVAVADLEPGEKITNVEAQFRLREFVPGTAPPKAIPPWEARAKPDKLRDRILVRPLGRGEAITEHHLKDTGGNGEPPPHRRSLAAPFRPFMADLVAPEDRADLIALYSIEGKTVARTFLQNVRILAINPDLNPVSKPVGDVRYVTFEVKVEQAEKVIWVLKNSQLITLSVRRPDDSAVMKTEGVGNPHPKQTDD